MNTLRHVVMLAAGSGGDVAPFVSLGKTFASRGISSTLLAPARYAPYVRDSPLAFESIGAEDVFEEVFNGGDIWHPRRGLAASWRYYAAAMATAYAKVSARWQPVDTLLVSSSFAVGARALQTRLGFRNTTVHLSPAVIFSHQQPARWPDPSIPPQWPVWIKRALAAAAERFGVDPTIRRALREPAGQLGIDLPAYIFSTWIHSPTRVCYAFPEWFAAAAPDWPATGVYAGFPSGLQTAGNIDARLAQFIPSSGNRLAVVTAGTAVAMSPPWVSRMLAILSRQGWHVLVVGGTPPAEQPGNAAVNTLHTPYAPFNLLFPKAQLVIHHGGIGTMAEAMRAGVPQILFPSAHDQFDNAARLETLGAGLSMKETAAEAELEHGLQAILHSAPAPAQSLRERLESGPTAEAIIADQVIADWERAAQ